MKKILLLSLLSVFTLSATFAQNVDLRRKIEVTGSAEAEVTPDIIYLSISLKEYFKDNNNKKKVEIGELERQLQTAVLNAGIPKENFTIDNISSYANWLNQKKTPDFLARKQYRIKVTDLNKFNQIMASIDPKGIESSNINGYDYSKMESLKKELKIKAIQSAKEKAIYLTEAIGEKIGNALGIREYGGNESFPQPMFYNSNIRMRGDNSLSENIVMPEIDFKKVKLTYQVNVVFEVK